MGAKNQGTEEVSEVSTMEVEMKELVTIDLMINDVEYTVDGYASFYEDRNYGADADGNRGTCRTVVTDITDIGVYGSDFENIYHKLTDAEKDRCAAALTRKFLEEQ
jgi:hypothetical protein